MASYYEILIPLPFRRSLRLCDGWHLTLTIAANGQPNPLDMRILYDVNRLQLDGLKPLNADESIGVAAVTVKSVGLSKRQEPGETRDAHF